MERCVLHIKFEYIIYVYIFFMLDPETSGSQIQKYSKHTNTATHIFHFFICSQQTKKSQTNDECLRKSINSYE